MLRGIVCVLCLIFACRTSNTSNEVRWISTDTIYEGLPLYLRYPGYNDIWQYSKQFTKLACIEHILDSCKSNGLPESDYNKTLMDFDGELVGLFDPEKEGIAILVETFAGKRYYWYYLGDERSFNSKKDFIAQRYPFHKLNASIRDDRDWGFIKEYPINLYRKD